MSSKVKALSSLRKIPTVNEKKIDLDSVKLFNRLIIFAQREMTVETSLQYELTPFPLSLFIFYVYCHYYVDCDICIMCAKSIELSGILGL